MLFKLGKTSPLVSTWTKETSWGLAVTVLPLLIFFIVLWDTLTRGEPWNFICLAAVSRGIYQIRRGICQILPRNTVGPTHYFVLYTSMQIHLHLSTQVHMFKNQFFLNFDTRTQNPFFRPGPDASGYWVPGISGHLGRHPAVPYV